MVETNEITKLTTVVFSGLIPLLVMACGSPSVTQSQQKNGTQATGGVMASRR